MLPYLEQAPLHDQLRVTQGNLYSNLLSTNWQPVLAGLQTPITAFICPSDTGYQAPRQVHNDRRFNGGVGWAAHNFTPGVSNYMGNAGHNVGRLNTQSQHRNLLRQQQCRVQGYTRWHEQYICRR